MISLFVAKIKTQFWRNSKILDEIWKFDYSTIFENYFINKKTNTHQLVFLHLSYIITSIFHQHSYLSEKLPLKFCVWFSQKQNCFCLFHILLLPKLFLSPQKLKNFSWTPLYLSNPIMTIKNVIHSYDILAPRVGRRVKKTISQIVFSKWVSRTTSREQLVAAWVWQDFEPWVQIL